MSTAVVAEQRAWYLNRWNQLVLGVIAMMAISSPQYTWTLFTGPLNQKLRTTLAELQWTFSLLIVLQTWFSPFQAYLVDRFGPRLLISVGAIMSGGSWVLAALSDNLWALYLTYGVIGGFGTGIIYVGIIGLMVRWFPDRRGLAAGLAAAGYGLRRDFHQLSDRQHDQKLGLCAHAAGLGNHSRRSRHYRGARIALAAGELPRSERCNRCGRSAPKRTQLFAN
jgi:hypothetical protein